MLMSMKRQKAKMGDQTHQDETVLKVRLIKFMQTRRNAQLDPGRAKAGHEIAADEFPF